MKVSLTINVDHLVIDKLELKGLKVLNFGDVYLKYEISVTDEIKYSNRQKYLAKEISLLTENVIIVDNPCYDLEDVNVLITELNKYNLSLDKVYIPSEERIKDRIQKAIEEQKKWGYREGITDEEIVRNFENFRATLNEIKDGLINTSIEVKAV